MTRKNKKILFTLGIVAGALLLFRKKSQAAIYPPNLTPEQIRQYQQEVMNATRGRGDGNYTGIRPPEGATPTYIPSPKTPVGTVAVHDAEGRVIFVDGRSY